MTSERPEASSPFWAAEHSMVLDDLLRRFEPLAIVYPELRLALEEVPAWREASARARRQDSYLVPHVADELSASALLWELVIGMRAAAENHPELARVLTRATLQPESAWWVAVRAVHDRTQWQHRRPPTLERKADGSNDQATADKERLRAQHRADRLRWARGSTSSTPAPSLLSRLGVFRMRRSRE